jgi:hydrogenase maturation protease
VWLLDAASSGAEPGTVHRFVATEEALPREAFVTSSHHLGLADAVELARTVGRLPRELVVLGIEGASFAAGEGLTPAVEAGVRLAADAVLEEICDR